jgi:hypothetical protein
MATLIKQHVCIKFCFKLGKSTTETLKTFDCSFGEDTVGRKEVFEWLSMFKTGMISAEDAKCSGHTFMRKTQKNMDRVKELFLETEEPLSMKLPACWEFHLGQSLAFLKTV